MHKKLLTPQAFKSASGKGRIKLIGARHDIAREDNAYGHRSRENEKNRNLIYDGVLAVY